MGNTIKGKEVIAYKGMEIDMTCKGFQYEVGKTYKTDKVKLCERGFHACLNPKNLFGYYSRKTKSRYFKVKLSGEITKCYKTDTKVAATEMTILEEINIDEIIETTEWWKHENVLDLLYFSNGLARVQRKDKWNFIDKNGKFLSDEWFMYVYDFKGGFAVVEKTNGKWCKIDKTGKLINEKEMEVEVYNRNFPTWVDGLPLVTTIERNDKYLKIERENHYGKLHSMQRDGDKVSYYLNGVEVSKKMWQEYIRIWKKNW